MNKVVAISMSDPNQLCNSELREELVRANTQLIAQAQTIAQLQASCNAMSAAIGNLCEMQLSARFSDVHNELDRMAQLYRKIQSNLAARRTH